MSIWHIIKQICPFIREICDFIVLSKIIALGFASCNNFASDNKIPYFSHAGPYLYSISFAASADTVTLEHWECSFPQNVPPTENTATAEELLKGFFEFYSHFDFNTYLVNLRDGIPEDLKDFRPKALDTANLETFKVGYYTCIVITW